MTNSDIPICPPPDAEIKTPKIKLPVGSVDTHAHVFGPEDQYPLSPNRGYTPYEAKLETLLKMHATFGVERLVLTQPSVYGTDNRAMLDAIGQFPDRIRGVVAVGPEVTDKELEDFHNQGIRGIRVNLVDKGGMPFASIEEFCQFAERLKPFGWHLELLIHVHEFPDIRETLGKLPVDISVGHLGYMKTSAGIDHPGFQDFLNLVRDGHCWVKLTGTYRITTHEKTPYLDVTPTAHALIDANPDRLIWGSDWPHVATYGAMPNDADLLDHMLDWTADTKIHQKIFVDNPNQLFGF
ncbi:MAG: amidohydrolase family protein [Rhodospirillaceae bacterium]|jgi:2-pyrone-4,6-dicarboxylate lactonase|nr:amidohydrolase family protein [Rhodospirillaceae bacterium]MBT4589180.1 amidohydrolase family protein [Rhodospirillaceae bacterium]MBT5941743.1 amidohydrolase family protein [Rhodospirillaceae bacterium]